jgi:hypothetical protein
VSTSPPPELGPPEDESGVLVAADRLLARSADRRAAILCRGAVGYGTGLVVWLEAVLRAAGDEPDWRAAVDGTDPGGLRVGFGSAAGPALDASLDGTPAWLPRSASGGGSRYEVQLWVTPYPADGVLTINCGWSARGIGSTATTLALPPAAEVRRRGQSVWE